MFFVFVVFCDTTRKASENLTFINEQSIVLSSGCVIVMWPVGDLQQNSDKVLLWLISTAKQLQQTYKIIAIVIRYLGLGYLNIRKQLHNQNNSRNA